jgi:hypothetical protein
MRERVLGSLYHYDPQTALLIGPFPWATLLIWLMIAFGVVALAVRILRIQDFA